MLSVFLQRLESERPGRGQKQILAVLLLSAINTSHISPMKALNALSFLQYLGYVECLMFLKESEGRRSVRSRTCGEGPVYRAAFQPLCIPCSAGYQCCRGWVLPALSYIAVPCVGTESQ